MPSPTAGCTAGCTSLHSILCPCQLPACRRNKLQRLCSSLTTRLAHLLLLHSQAAPLRCCRCTGYDKVDLVAAKRLGVAVTRVPSYSPASVAEHSVGMMLCLNRWGLTFITLSCRFERGAVPGQVGAAGSTHELPS